MLYCHMENIWLEVKRNGGKGMSYYVQVRKTAPVVLNWEDTDSDHETRRRTKKG